MDTTTIPIAIGFILLAALLCWIAIGARGHWLLKLAVILLVPSFGLVVWKSIGSYRGYPTNDPLPDRVMLVGVSIREPNPSTSDPGNIYLWVIDVSEAIEDPDLFDYRNPPGEPRSHKMAYSRKMHEMMDEARRRMAEGEAVFLERSGKDGGRPGPEGEPGEPNGEGQDGFHYEDPDQSIRFYDLPPPGMPPKDPLPGMFQ